ncbi:deoxyribonuclease V [Longispora albida]|uniref:deoxyribonuclease V n=1 Tax=Longispora albida TaxID=203523 RepID=UPI0004759055|nr:deoxyribonuclease V [Longispora albida]
MRLDPLHEWPSTPAEAEAIQDRLRSRVILSGAPAGVRTVAGLDVAYADDRLAAAVVVLDAETLQPVDEAVALGVPAFEYVPGLFAFREIPMLVQALERLTVTPDLLVCDGQGVAHPRRFGLACHLGLLTGLPAIGVAKTLFVGTHDEPPQPRSARTDLLDDGEVIGAVLRTQPGIKPVYVSAGHLIGLDEACDWTLRLAPRYRLPETTRLADQLSRRALSAP